ncbi:MAG TPA: AraC family transcriptional regulator [Dinghuibacter sp.]|uniref:helix-turn-helix domain-containing protein n=1 Tax=Dinghuibacter sp. TaxID=2024697 RepID=UPI002C0AD9E7|nr:AraC family transcriptional regulator [Dinghuibacter sp.]HTJ12633.1 AraC family transcriptional regulator [Dinghuibacter sp.]
MRPVIQQIGDSFVYSCTFDKAYTYEQFVPEHVLAYQISGQTRIYHQSGEMVLEEGHLLLARRNQFAKSIKIPAEGKKYQCISVVLSTTRLRQFSKANGIVCVEKYSGKKNILLRKDDFWKGYFQSLLPYVDRWSNVSAGLLNLKATEAIELLLHLNPGLETFLFDFADPYKEDLEAFMLNNFQYNAPLEYFARLSGRSLTGFKRDFAGVFKTSPATWLKNKRLSEALYLIREKKQKPRDIYIDLGFENLSHFYTAFKQKYGRTPAEVTTKK